jgi:hypothetical protein
VTGDRLQGCGRRSNRRDLRRGAVQNSSRKIRGQMVVDQRQRGVDPFVVLRIGQIADADQLSVGGKQASAAAADHRLARHLDVGRSQVLVQRRHAALANRGVRAAVTADAEHLVSWPDLIVSRGDGHGGDRDSRPDDHQRDVVFQVVRQQLAGHRTARAGSEQIHLDPALARRVAEQVPASHHERFVVLCIDDRSRAETVPRGVFDPQSDTGVQSPLLRIHRGGSG